MYTFKDYVDKAKKKQNFTTVRQVAEALGVTPSAIANFKKGPQYPSQETVFKLANLAGVKPEQALIDFNLWKTKDKPNAHKVWQNLSKMIGCLSVFVIFCAYNSNTYKNINLEYLYQYQPRMYIMDT